MSRNHWDNDPVPVMTVSGCRQLGVEHSFNPFSIILCDLVAQESHSPQAEIVNKSKPRSAISIAAVLESLANATETQFQWRPLKLLFICFNVETIDSKIRQYVKKMFTGISRWVTSQSADETHTNLITMATGL